MNLKQLTPIIPYLTGFVICMGIIKQIFFYHFFLIPIKNYLDVGEVLMLFTDDIILITLCTIPYLLYIFFRIARVKRQIAMNMPTVMPISNRNMSLVSFTLAWLCLLLIAGCICLLFWFPSYFDKVDNTIKIFVGVFFLAYLFAQRYFAKLPSDAVEHFYLVTIVTMVTFAAIVADRTVKEAKSIYNGKYIGTIIYAKDSTYTSDSSHFFVGRTNNYSFIFNRTERTSIILPNSEILKTLLKSK
jgi:hypothetical protein